jgi:L-fucose mutarotase
MLKSPILHPEMLSALGRIGHGSKVLLTDANYPHATATAASAARVYLNYAPGVLSVLDVLGPLLDAIPVEAAAVMRPMRQGPYAMAEDPPIFADFLDMLGGHGVDRLDPIDRFAFYDAARSPDVGLVVATGEQRIYANLLLTLGVVMPD